LLPLQVHFLAAFTREFIQPPCRFFEIAFGNNGIPPVDLGVGCTGLLASQDKPLNIGGRDRSRTATAEKRKDMFAYAALYSALAMEA
jgi:hypothetical protein